MKQSLKKGFGKGFKRTPQRLAILDYLEGNTLHPSAEDVYRAVTKKYFSLSFATVYNTLNTLAQSGAVRELTLDPERKRYDPNTEPHHHLICVTCKKVIDVFEDVTVGIPKRIEKEFSIFGNHVEFYGCCSVCRKKSNSA
jgi:Fur family transcriptional regulator, peroxide stress response regulator